MWRRIAIGLALTLSPHVAAHGQQRVDAREGFERLKRLVGTWTATEKGRSRSEQVVTYKMAGGGRVLVLEMGGSLNDAYHLDGDKLMLTHYCGSGNQPRMRVREADDRHIAFEMFDITNLANPQSYHTTHLDVVFVSPDRVELSYRGTSGGRESTQVFQLTRKKT